MRNLRTVRRALLGLTTSVALAGGALVVTPAAAATDPHPRAVAATTWLSKELGRDLPFQQYGSPSWGPTLDAFFALNSLNVRAVLQRQVLDELAKNVDSYVVDWQGNDVAGAIAKALSAAQADGRDIETFGGGGLLSRLEAQIDTSGANDGRVHEYYTWEGVEYDAANSLDQAWAVRALAVADNQHEDRVLEFLLKQQCDNGGFRQDFGPDSTCTPNVDTTALAVLSILQARSAGVDVDAATLQSSLGAAARWLVSVQRNNGGFAGASGVSSDSTGLAATALQALGRTRPAAKAAAWVKGRQVTARMARNTAIAKRDIGAVAPTQAALVKAKRRGVTNGVRINWRLATAQAAPGLNALISR